nr:3075_t:CDS:2 [Entrophospora candida]
MVILIVKGDKPTTPRSNDIPIPYVESYFHLASNQDKGNKENIPKKFQVKVMISTIEAPEKMMMIIQQGAIS